MAKFPEISPPPPPSPINGEGISQVIYARYILDIIIEDPGASKNRLHPGTGELAERSGVAVLLKSLGRFAARVRVIEVYEHGRLEAGALRHSGPDLVFGRLGRELVLDTARPRLLPDRGFEFPVERGPSTSPCFIAWLSKLPRLLVCPFLLLD